MFLRQYDVRVRGRPGGVRTKKPQSRETQSTANKDKGYGAIQRDVDLNDTLSVA